jgi:hypothetical protein
MSTLKVKADNPMAHVVAYGQMLIAEMERTWQAHAVQAIDWDRMADLSSRRFGEFVREMSWRVIQIGRKPEYFEEGSHVLDQFLTLTGEMLTHAPVGVNSPAIEKIRTARAKCNERRAWFEKKKHESAAYFAKVNELCERLSRS